MNHKILVVCHSNRSLGAEEVIRFLVSESLRSKNCSYHFGIHKGVKISNQALIAYEVEHQSFFERLLFEQRTLPKIIEQDEYDYVLSLQNFILKNYRVRTGLLIHQGLMVIKYKYPFYEIQLRVRVAIQKLLFSLFQRYVHDFFVQLPWMKQQLKSTFSIESKNIHVIRTHGLHRNETKLADTTGLVNLIYPASGFHYKNHRMILNGLKLIDKKLWDNLQIDFTLNADDNVLTRQLHNSVTRLRLPIRFIGTIDHSDLLQRYNSQMVIFSSLVESQGMPLIEAMQAGTTIICLDIPFARQSLTDYPNALFFNSSEDLANILKTILNGELILNNYHKVQLKNDSKSLITFLEEDIL